ncbi:MAG: NHL repeat-containing protein [Desulfobulbaceae bacterium]
MSAVNVIVNRAPAWMLALMLGLFYPVSPTVLAAVQDAPAATPAAAPVGAPASSPGGSRSLAGQLEQMTEKKGPRAGGNGNSQPFGSSITDLEVVSIIKADEQGKGLRMPSYVFCDRATDEAYVVDNGRVTVYGDNFFPAASIGQGRGLITALSVYVDREGNVYVPQGPYYGEPARISVYNAAFLPVRKIDLGDIPGGGTGNPKSMIIGDNGFIYLAFETGVRGLLVLDKEGRFSHWLKPMDLIFDQAAIGESREAKEQEEEGEATGEEPEFDVSELVPELVPKTGEQVFAEEIEPGMGPVQVNDVQRDKEGNLYLLSTETSKVYIYNNAEEYLYNFGEKGGSTGKLSQPRQLVVDDKKKAIYIVDYNRHAILIYDLSGRFMHEFGGKGNLPGWFQYPRSIATNTKGQLLVADMFNNRVQVLDVQFEYKFPLFQVPFVFDQEGVLLPQPVQASRGRFYAPGFGAGEQASATGDKEEIKALLESDGDVI